MSSGFEGRAEAGPRPIPALPDDAHKGTAGRALCLAGSPSMPGAALLAARAAMRAGVGLLTVVTRSEKQDVLVVGACPEAILHSAPDAQDLAELFGEPERFHARLVGPGLGRDEWAAGALRAALNGSDARPLVLDADALNLVAGDLDRLARRPSNGPLVLTPHPGEARRLLGHEVPGDDAGRRSAAEELARRSAAIVCLKGPRTLVTDGRRTHLNATGNAGMATAGAGDVLSGILVAYLAFAECCGADWGAFDAAVAAVRVHGIAGDLGAEELGRRALIASDLIDFLPRAQRAPGP